MFRRPLIAAAIAGSLLTSIASAQSTTHEDLVRRGRYLSVIGGCNDCHTPGFAVHGGNVPEAQWLTGDTLGFSGPWGTTYPSNIRLRLANMDLPAFKAYAHSLKTRPPMPYWALNAMSDDDLAALHAFVRSLGAPGTAAPAALPPGVAASGPVVQFPAPPAQ